MRRQIVDLKKTIRRRQIDTNRTRTKLFDTYQETNVNIKHIISYHQTVEPLNHRTNIIIIIIIIIITPPSSSSTPKPHPASCQAIATSPCGWNLTIFSKWEKWSKPFAQFFSPPQGAGNVIVLVMMIANKTSEAFKCFQPQMIMKKWWFEGRKDPKANSTNASLAPARFNLFFFETMS